MLVGKAYAGLVEVCVLQFMLVFVFELNGTGSGHMLVWFLDL